MTVVTSVRAVLREVAVSADEIVRWFDSVDGLAELERAYPLPPNVERPSASPLDRS